MANKKISDLASAAALSGTEELPVVQSAATVKATVQSIADLYEGTAEESGPTPDTLALRDADGRSQFADPEVDADAATKKYVDDNTADVPTPPTKGGMLVSDGSAWQVLAVGSDGEQLVADSAEALGVRWAAVGEEGGGSSTPPSLVGGFTSNELNLDTQTVDSPGGTVEQGDLIFVSLAHQADRVVTAPSGFTQLIKQDPPATESGYQRLYVKVAPDQTTDPEPSDYTFTLDSTTRCRITRWSVRGGDSAAILVDGSASLTLPELTAVDNSLLIGSWSMYDSGGELNDAPSPWTTELNAVAGTVRQSQVVASQTVDAGATPTTEVTVVTGDSGQACIALSVGPA